jgi:hypothetical protein
MSGNYTPVDLQKYLNLPPQGAKKLNGGKSKFNFDKIIFPFSLAILLMSLTFYGVKYLVDFSSTTPKASGSDPLKVAAVVQPSLAPLQEPTVTLAPDQAVYAMIDQIQIDSSKVLESAKPLYPDLTPPQLIVQVNKDLIEWAAVRKYFQKDATLSASLRAQTNIPLTSFPDIKADVDQLVIIYNQDTSADRSPLVQTAKKRQVLQYQPKDL